MSERLIYSVELDLAERNREADFEEWYAEHLRQLLSVPGIAAVQRFKSLTDSASPYLALYDIDSVDVLESTAYRSVGGPRSASQWKLVNWHRNVFAGEGSWPDVAMSSNLLVLDGTTQADAPNLPAGWLNLVPVALDRSVERRILAAVSNAIADYSSDQYHPWTARVFRPVTDRSGRRLVEEQVPMATIEGKL